MTWASTSIRPGDRIARIPAAASESCTWVIRSLPPPLCRLVDERAQRVVQDIGGEPRGRPWRDGLVVARDQILGVARAAGSRRSRRGGARVAAEQVRQRVAVRRHEVEPASARHRRRDRVPPALRRALVLAERAVEQADEQIAVVRDHVAQDVVRPRAERAAQPGDRGVVAERARERGVVGDVGDPRGQQALAQLVPLDLVRGQDRDEVVDVGRRGDEHREGLAAVPAQRPAPAAGPDDLPAIDRVPGVVELVVRLAEHDPADPRHAVRQPASGSTRTPRDRARRPGHPGAGSSASTGAPLRTRARARHRSTGDREYIGTDIEVDLVAGSARRLAIHGARVDHPWLRSASWTSDKSNFSRGDFTSPDCASERGDSPTSFAVRHDERGNTDGNF